MCKCRLNKGRISKALMIVRQILNSVRRLDFYENALNCTEIIIKLSLS